MLEEYLVGELPEGEKAVVDPPTPAAGGWLGFFGL